MYENELKPGTPAPASGSYEEVNVLGSPTGFVVEVRRDNALPALPRGFTWRLIARPRISDMAVADLLKKAAEFGRMAATASTVETRNALLRIAQRFADLAEERCGGPGLVNGD
jgi:hypothetical protein